jgi:hypothetical protein
MKWEEGADLDDIDEDDRAAFEGLRKVRQPNMFICVAFPIELLPEGASFAHGFRIIH